MFLFIFEKTIENCNMDALIRMKIKAQEQEVLDKDEFAPFLHLIEWKINELTLK